MLCRRRDRLLSLCRAVPAAALKEMQHTSLWHTGFMRGLLGHRRFTTSRLLSNLTLGECNTGCPAMPTFNFTRLFNYFAHLICCCVVLFFAIFCRVEAITYINSDITVNTVWTKSGSPYVYATICCFWCFRFACAELCVSRCLFRVLGRSMAACALARVAVAVHSCCAVFLCFLLFSFGCFCCSHCVSVVVAVVILLLCSL